MEDPKSLEEWADETLARHRVEYKQYEAPRWLTRDLPKIGAAMQLAEAVAFFVLAVILLGAVAVAFNSG